ncbi:hypothetical protein KXD40_001062 [Peronospora effusa]|uniref:HTH CENPB-type domain-containing protein n=1 Tax=Peronospora effusa TaxID=542832 RepID=A0A425C6D8_9STRA|nr:hypothetical protein DD237_005396 [Peronospora effusa]UIZ20517.1 hypothetical protein KXD40_001062 [Peronospora effusa]CAI5724027.1 unnamed protein product [Peronospora effusa]
MGPRGAGRRLNDQERMEILEIIQREAKVKNVDLAKRYGVSEGAIRKLKQMKDTVRNRYFMGNEHNRDKRKRGGFKRNAPFEEELYQWIVRMRDSQPYQLMPLTQTAVRQQAIVLAKNYDKMANFKASPGWFARFCSRHQLDPIVTAVDTTAVTALVAPDSTTLGADTGVPQAMTTSASADETVFLMETLTSSPVTTSEIVNEGTGCKTETPSINEQVQQAAREHNEAALRAAAVKIDEVQASAVNESEEKEAKTQSELDEETEEEHEEVKTPLGDATAMTIDDDEIFSLGL